MAINALLVGKQLNFMPSCRPGAFNSVCWPAQVYELRSTEFLPQEWIEKRWSHGYNITAIADSAGEFTRTIMEKPSPYTNESFMVCNLFRPQEIGCYDEEAQVEQV